MQLLPKPIKFDKLFPWVIVARDGEQFYVCKEEEFLDNKDVFSSDVFDLVSFKSFLQWAIEVNYTVRSFVKVQKKLVDDYFLDS
jgi:hypothetical protein